MARGRYWRRADRSHRESRYTLRFIERLRGLTRTRAVESGAGAAGEPRRRVTRWRRVVGRIVTGLAAFLVLAALILPSRPGFGPGAVLRIPVEVLAAVALVLLLPARAGRIVAGVGGALVGLLAVMKVFDIGFFSVLDRPFDPMGDWPFLTAGADYLRRSHGRAGEIGAIVGAVALAVGLLVVMTLAAVRLARVVPGPSHAGGADRGGARGRLGRRRGGRRAAGRPEHVRARLRPRGPGRVRRARPQRVRVRDGHRRVPGRAGRAAAHRPARQGRHLRVRGELRAGRVAGPADLAGGPGGAHGRERPAARGRVLGPQRLADLVDLRRRQLAGPLHAGVRGVDQHPAALRRPASKRPVHAGPALPPGRLAHGRRGAGRQPGLAGGRRPRFDKVYDERNLGYRGPRFSFSTMPDQYTLAILQEPSVRRRATAPGDGPDRHAVQPRPVGAGAAAVDWNNVGDGSVFKARPETARPDLLAPTAAGCGPTTGARSSTR